MVNTAVSSQRRGVVAHVNLTSDFEAVVYRRVSQVWSPDYRVIPITG